LSKVATCVLASLADEVRPTRSATSETNDISGGLQPKPCSSITASVQSMHPHQTRQETPRDLQIIGARRRLVGAAARYFRIDHGRRGPRRPDEGGENFASGSGNTENICSAALGFVVIFKADADIRCPNEDFLKRVAIRMGSFKELNPSGKSGQNSKGDAARGSPGSK
jgi:hypothetical protein